MLKDFKTLLDLDISKYVSKKPTFKKVGGKFVETGIKLDYLSWVDCLILLYENGAESVSYGNIHNADGHSLFTHNNALPEVRVYVEIDGKRYEETYPLIDGSKVIDISNATQADIHNATQRAFVKCVAINTGLGLKLWQKEDKIIESLKINEDAHSFKICTERLLKKFAGAVEKTGSEANVLRVLNLNEKQLKTFVNCLKSAETIEQKIEVILNDNQ